MYYSISFVSMSKTIYIRPIASCASLKPATHAAFDARIHYSRNCFFDALRRKVAADACLLREIQIKTRETCTICIRF
jgi:hypothetical protein